LTGEEDEDAILELKGVKMYVKRGEDNFSGGMVGHIKLLSHKTTLSQRLRSSSCFHSRALIIEKKMKSFAGNLCGRSP
jgi:hypothetical protein